MPMASAFGISGDHLNMMWKANVTITLGEYSLSLDMADSLFAAMNSAQGTQGLLYNPVIQISYEDEDYIRNLFDQLRGTYA
jgi:hypothetical protein